jgi:beta-galactosidase
MLKADGQDLAFINIAVTDQAGTVKVLDDRLVTVSVKGAGSLQGLGSGNPVTEEVFHDSNHTTYYGRALAVVRAGHETGEIEVTISSEGLAPQTVVLTVQE